MLRCAAARRLRAQPAATSQLPIVVPMIHAAAGPKDPLFTDVSSPHVAQAGIGEAPETGVSSGIGDTSPSFCGVCQLAGPEDVPLGIGDLLGEPPRATAELAGGQLAGVPHSGGAAAAAGQAGARKMEHPKRGSSQNTTDVTAVAAGCSEAK